MNIEDMNNQDNLKMSDSDYILTNEPLTYNCTFISRFYSLLTG